MARKTLLVLAFVVTSLGILSALAPECRFTGDNRPGNLHTSTARRTRRPECLLNLEHTADDVYTALMTIPATRPRPDDTRQFVFSETHRVPPVYSISGFHPARFPDTSS
jgi:hypothetical protein